MGDHILILQTGLKKKETISSKNEDDKCFQYAATVAINHEEIKRDPQRVSKIKPFINKYNRNRTKHPFEKNHPTIALNILDDKEKEISPKLIRIVKKK